MSAWVSTAPVIGTGSLDGFAAAALMSVVCAMATTAARRPPAVRGGAHASERNGLLCEHVMAAEAVRIEAAGAGLAAADVARSEATVRAVATARRGMAWAGLADESFACGRSRSEAPPGIVFPGAEVAMVPFGRPRRPKVRRLPRHAAPPVSLGSRITGLGSRITGLFATRALAGGARG